MEVYYMRILLTNDDGFFAPGLKTLYKVLAEEKNYKLYIVAPERQRSAVSRSITLHKPLFVTKHEIEDNVIGYTVNGTPTDCVKIAIQGDVLPVKPDIIISGINAGPNLGTDVFYSGTVSAAMEGGLLGIPSLAVSVACYDCEDYFPSAKYIDSLLKKYSQIFRDNMVLNINLPYLKMNEWKGTKITKLGKSMYENTFEKRQTPAGKEYYWFSGNQIIDTEEGTDQKAVMDGYISITPLHGDLTEYSKIEELAKIII